MKVIIAGSRDFHNYAVVKSFCDTCLQWYNVTEIVSGKCDGVDKLGERYARENKYIIKDFPADWSQGKKAGPIRNRQMAEYADTLIAFWDGKSPGTNSMIKEAKKCKLQIFIYPL